MEKERRAKNSRVGKAVETVPQYPCPECRRVIGMESDGDGGLREVYARTSRPHECWVRAREAMTTETESLAVYAREGMLWCVIRWLRACGVTMVQVVPDMHLIIIDSPGGFREKLKENVWVMEFEEADGEIPNVFQDGMEVQ